MAQLVVCVYGLFLFFRVFFLLRTENPVGFTVLDCWLGRRLDWERWLEIVP